MPGWILEELSPHPFALPFADQTTVALPITGGPLKLFVVIPAIIARTGSASALSTLGWIRVGHAKNYETTCLLSFGFTEASRILRF